MHNEKNYISDNFWRDNISGCFSVPTICIYRDSMSVLRYDKGVAIATFGKHLRSIYDASAFTSATAFITAAFSQEVGYMPYGGTSAGGVYMADGDHVSAN